MTGHFPHWVLVTKDNADRHIRAAIFNYTHYIVAQVAQGTYEAVGPGIQGNPYDIKFETLHYHGDLICSSCPSDFDCMRQWLYTNEIEGVVFWKDGAPVCKIKRSDFGLPWPVKRV